MVCLKFFEKNDLDGAAGHLKLLPYAIKLWRIESKKGQYFGRPSFYML